MGVSMFTVDEVDLQEPNIAASSSEIDISSRTCSTTNTQEVVADGRMNS